MGFFNNSITPRVTPLSEQEKRNPLLVEGEELEATVNLVFDKILITNRRIIFVDHKVLTTRRKYISIPYNRISAIEIELGGAMELSRELTIVVGSREYEIKSTSIDGITYIYNKLVQKTL